MARTTVVRLTGEDLTAADVWEVAVEGASAELDDSAREKMAAAREVVDRAVAAEGPTYGVTTGFGRFVSTRVPEEFAEELQLRLLRSHACGVGDPYPDDYDPTVARNVREQEADARPAIANPLTSIDRYDTVLLGSPIWNVRAPMIMSTFTESLDFTGKTIWSSKELSDRAGYASPIVADVQGVRTIMTLTAEAGVGVRASDGKLMWRYRPVANSTANITTPVFSDNRVFYSSAYGTGGELLGLRAEGGEVRAQEIYFTRDMENTQK